MMPGNDAIAAAGRPGLRWRLEALTKKGASAEAPAPELGGRNDGEWSLERDRPVIRIGGTGLGGRGRVGVDRRSAVAIGRLVG